MQKNKTTDFNLILKWIKFAVKAYEALIIIYREEFKKEQDVKKEPVNSDTDIPVTDGDFHPYTEVVDSKINDDDTNQTERHS